MSRQDLVFIASRTFALYLTVWGLVELTYMPDHLVSLLHHMSQQSLLSSNNYSTAYYIVYDSFAMLRMIALLSAAAFFWRCGPRVQAIFNDGPENAQQALD